MVQKLEAVFDKSVTKMGMVRKGLSLTNISVKRMSIFDFLELLVGWFFHTIKARSFSKFEVLR